ncbi:hypothetical protein Tco_1491184 [Tanacetum coccineum]
MVTRIFNYSETETISVETLVSNPSESDDFSLGECNLFDIDDSYYEKSTSRFAHLAPISPEIVEACDDDDDTDEDYDYDDNVYVDDCVDIEEDGGEIDLDISKIVDVSLREKLVESYLLIEKVNAFSLSPPIPISPIFCPSSTIPVVDLDLPLEEVDVPSFSDDSMIFPEYESFTFDDEPVMAEVNVFDEINTSELSYPGIGENVILEEEEDTFTFTTRSFLPFVTYPEVLPASYSTGSEDKVFKPGIFYNMLTRKSSLTLDVVDPLHPPLMDFHVTKAFSGFTFTLLKIFSKKFFEPGINNATVYLSSLVWGGFHLLEFLHPHYYCLYTLNCGCLKGSLEDKILVPKPPRNCVRCARCGTPVDGPYCQGCALLRKEFIEGLLTNCVENEFFKDFQDTSESSDDNTNVVNAPREPIVVNQDPGENSSPSPPHIDHCCHECGDSLDGIFCRQCMCKSCGKGAHYGYNCHPKVPIISNPEPCKNQTIDRAPVTAVAESCVTCGGGHSYQNCPATNNNIYHDNIQEYVSNFNAANFNQANSVVSNPIRPPGFPPLQNPHANSQHANSQNNFNRGNNFNQNRGNNFNQGQIYRPPVNQPVAHQGPAPQTHGVSKTDFERYVTANDAVLRNMQNQGQNLQSQMANLTDMLSKFVTANTASTSGSGTLPGNTITNPKEDLKGITTRSGVTIQGPKAVNHDTEVTKDTMPPANNGSTEDVQPPVVQIQSRNPNPEPNVAPVDTPVPKASIPFPSRRNDEKRKEKANDQIEKFYEIFRDLSFEISFTDALMLMPKFASTFASTLKTLIGNKEKIERIWQQLL